MARLPGAARWRHLAILLLLSGSAHAQPFAPAATTPAVPAALAPLPEHPLEAVLVARTNVERSRAGLGSLAPSEVLAQAARHHAEEMVRLGYFSHVSPTAGRARPSDRVAAVGGTAVAVGENLAALARGGGDLAERAIAAWMNSADHRGNLLRPEWTHVGFGVREAPDGEAYVVKVLASDPWPLLEVSATRDGAPSVALRFEIASRAGGWLAVTGSRSLAPPTPVVLGGSTLITVEGIAVDARTHLRLEWTENPATVFVGQESGWFDPEERSWISDWLAEGTVAEVVSVDATRPTPDVWVRVRFAVAPNAVVVFVDGREVVLELDGVEAAFAVPGRDGVVEVDLGTPLGATHVTVWHAFDVVVVDGVVRLMGRRTF